jgi:hypothetical protein
MVVLAASTIKVKVWATDDRTDVANELSVKSIQKLLVTSVYDSLPHEG